MAARMIQNRNSDRRLAARIARSMAAALPAVMTQIQQLQAAAPAPAPAPAVAPQPICTFKTFQGAKPPTFDGK